MSDGHTILVVEDEPLIRQAICEYLRDCGLTILEAADAEKAVILLLVNAQIDLVFTDVRMPGQMDGLDLARWVMENRPHIPVMIATGDVGRVSAMHDICTAETFTKPYDQDSVAERIQTVLQKRRAGL